MVFEISTSGQSMRILPTMTKSFPFSLITITLLYIKIIYMDRNHFKLKLGLLYFFLQQQNSVLKRSFTERVINTAIGFLSSNGRYGRFDASRISLLLRLKLENTIEISTYKYIHRVKTNKLYKVFYVNFRERDRVQKTVIFFKDAHRFIKKLKRPFLREMKAQNLFDPITLPKNYK